MSLGSFIKTEEGKIVTFLEGAEGEVKNVLLPAAIGVTNALKTIVSFDSDDIIGKLVGGAGAAIEDKVRTALPGVIADLQLAQAFAATNPTPDEIISKVVSIGVNLTGNARTAFLIEFAGTLATAISDGKLTLAESILLTQDLYGALGLTPVNS